MTSKQTDILTMASAAKITLSRQKAEQSFPMRDIVAYFFETGQMQVTINPPC